MARPVLGELELEKVQSIVVEGDQVLVEHGVPALEGDFLQRLGRRASKTKLRGFITGAGVLDSLKALREKLRAAEPVSFVADIASATRLDQVMIEEMGLRELAGKPARFEYAFLLREYIAPQPGETEVPPVVPPPPSTDTGRLIVNVVIENEPDFNFNLITVTVEGEQQDGTQISNQQLTNREGNRWNEAQFPPGDYSVLARADDPAMSGSASAAVRTGQEEEVTIMLRRGEQTRIAKAFIIHFHFDRAFIEPCMRHVLRKVVDYAAAQSGEKLLIVGHTDESGSNDYNQSLSERRSRSAYAYLTYGIDASRRAEAIAEWDSLRRSGSGLPRINDNWGVREYQYMLEDLGYYPANITGVHDSSTDSAVRAFQTDNSLSVDGDVGDQTWPVLIDKYLERSNFAIPDQRFLRNANDEGCDSGILKWLGCGERLPVNSTPRGQCATPAWRPNRRTELLFVTVDKLPCAIPHPVTFNLPAPGSVNSAWCLGPGSPGSPCCFITNDLTQQDRLLVQPAEAGIVSVQGSIKFEDGTPLSNARYVLIAPDGEFMDGEKICTPTKGLPIKGRTMADGSFSYPDKPKGVGIFTLEIDLISPQVARLAEDPSSAANGVIVCKDLNGTTPFDVIVSMQTAMVSGLEFVSAADIDSTPDSSTMGESLRLRAEVRNFQGDEIVVEIASGFPFSPPLIPTTSTLAIVDAANVDNKIGTVASGGSARLSAELPNITGDSVIVELTAEEP